MAKNIVLLSDGTGQSGGVGYETNIWRLYQALVHDPEQVCCYDDGVGSQDLKLLRAIGGAFGWGLSRNVRDLYAFLVRHWEPGDRIYLFGFSRGAFTVRLLTSLITQCGILDLKRIDSEARFDQLLRAAYCTARLMTFSPQMAAHFRAAYSLSGPAPVHFVGVWDTVNAMGVPFDELRDAIDQVIRYSFPDRVPCADMGHGCHALSLDDARRTFHPVLWDERIEDRPDRIEQVWFSGVHSNVGGGYPKPQLALVSLAWMIDRVAAYDLTQVGAGAPGLRLHPAAVDAIRRSANSHGRLYDSRSGLGAIYRFAPRNTEEIRKSYTSGALVVHESVRSRIDHATDQYAPHNLTEQAPEVIDAALDPKRGDAWRLAMEQCWSIVWLRRLIYSLVLASVGLWVLWLTWLLVTVPEAAGWLDRLLSAPWTFWGLVALVPLLIVARQSLKAWQRRIANTGWTSLFPRHRPGASATNLGAGSKQPDSSTSAGARFLTLVGRLRKSGGAKAVAEFWSAFLVRALALVLVLPLSLGRWIHSTLCFRGPGLKDLDVPNDLKVGEPHTLVFVPRTFAAPSGFRVKAGGCYDIRVERWSGWRDASLLASPDGLLKAPPPAVKHAKWLFRRPDLAPFALLVRVKGCRPVLIGSGNIIEPTASGHLEFFVNDADLRIPIIQDLFYCNNHGVARIRIERLAGPTAPRP